MGTIPAKAVARDPCRTLPLLLALASAASQAGAAEPAALARSTQIIVVTTPDWTALQGKLQRYERDSPRKSWRRVGEPVAIVVGRNGLGWGIGVTPSNDPASRSASDPIKKEGDGKAPAGVFALGTAFGYAPQPLPGTKLPYLHLTPAVECVDDVRSKRYNRVLDRASAAPDWNSSEHMRRSDELYRWGIVVAHNANPPVAGGGSCIFLHIWSGHGRGTAGCTAMPQSDLESLLTWLDPKRRPLLVQLPAAEYERLKNRWKLPR